MGLTQHGNWNFVLRQGIYLHDITGKIIYYEP